MDLQAAFRWEVSCLDEYWGTKMNFLSMLFLVLWFMNKVHVESHLLSQKTPRPSQHLRALELKDTRRETMKNVYRYFKAPAPYSSVYCTIMFKIKHVCKVNIQMFTRPSDWNKRPSFQRDIYRVRGGGGRPRNALTPHHRSGLRWPGLRNGRRTVWGGERRWRVVVEGGGCHKLARDIDGIW